MLVRGRAHRVVTILIGVKEQHRSILGHDKNPLRRERSRQLGKPLDSTQYNQGTTQIRARNQLQPMMFVHNLLKRVVLSARARQAKGTTPARPTFSIGSVSIFEPRDGVVESMVIVRGRASARAVAIRLEGLNSRSRATAINVL